MEFSHKLDAYSSGVFTLLKQGRERLTAQGVEVIDLGVGTPDLPPAPHVMQALCTAAAEPANYVYAISDRPQLLKAAADWYERRFGVTLDPARQIVSLMGSQDGLAHLPMALLDPGDTVLVPDPSYPIFSMGPYLAGARLVHVPQRRENGYIMDLRDISESDARQAKLMIVSYPNNPVGRHAPDSFYRDLVAFAHEYDIAVVHDNAYCELRFDGLEVGSFLAYPGAIDIGVELNSLSKTYSMPGVRMGFCLGNADIVARLRAFKSHIDYGAFLPLQIAAEAALNGPQDSVELTRRTYERRRDVFCDGLRSIGWQVDKPQGTMFVWARIPARYGDDDARFCLELMERTGVIVVPGSSFGEMGRGHVRVALVRDEETLRRAVERIAAADVI